MLVEFTKDSGNKKKGQRINTDPYYLRTLLADGTVVEVKEAKEEKKIAPEPAASKEVTKKKKGK